MNEIVSPAVDNTPKGAGGFYNCDQGHSHLACHLEVYRPAVPNTSLWGHDHSGRLSGLSHSRSCSLWTQIRPPETHSRIKPVSGHGCNCPLNPSLQQTGQHIPSQTALHLPDAKPPPCARLVTPTKSCPIFLAAREATSKQTLSSLALVTLTTSDQIKFNNKSQTGMTRSTLG